MDVFVSYARSDAATVQQMHADIERSRRSVWFDSDLEGGQRWWDLILEQIRSSSVFVFVVSPDSIDSRACRAELAYAVALGRPILPVRVRDVDLQMAPDPIPVLQVVDYRTRTPEAVIELVTAVNQVPEPAPLPDPLPVPPAAPLVSVAPLRELIAGPSLSYAEQLDVLRELRSRVTRPDERDLAVALLRELRARADVVESVGREIDAELARAAPSARTGRDSSAAGDESSADLLRSLVTQIKAGHCTPILGWGLTDSLIGPRHLMARKWATTFEFPMAAHQQEDLPQVAKFVAVMTDVETLREGLRDFYRDQLHQQYPDLPPSADTSAGLDELVRQAWNQHRATIAADPHLVLSELPFPIYLTAHPANVLAEALRHQGKEPVVEICRWRADVYDWPPSIFEREPDYVPDPAHPLVFHVFGNLAFPDSLVLTEDDYFDYLARVAENPAVVPLAVRDALADSALLLLGFRLDEWDVRVLLGSLVGQQGSKRLQKYRHVAAQLDLSNEVVSPARARRFLERYFGAYRQPSIDIFWGSVDDFAAGLVEAMVGNR